MAKISVSTSKMNLCVHVEFIFNFNTQYMKNNHIYMSKKKWTFMNISASTKLG